MLRAGYCGEEILALPNPQTRLPPLTGYPRLLTQHISSYPTRPEVASYIHTWGQGTLLLITLTYSILEHINPLKPAGYYNNNNNIY